jgi:hypothetical protein
VAELGAGEELQPIIKILVTPIRGRKKLRFMGSKNLKVLIFTTVYPKGHLTSWWWELYRQNKKPE